MRDVVKTNVKREQTSKRARRRKRNTKMYFFLVLILVLGIGVLLSVTLLFNINKINVKGEIDYSKDAVIKASGIEMGDNMVRLDAAEAEKRILNSMVYIESADISKKYPDTLEITLEKCIPSANVEYDGGILLLSPKGKILENMTEAQNDILTVKGMEPLTYNVGQYITSTDEQKTEIYFEIMEALKKCENSRVIWIDLTDKYDIKINYDNRITFEAGNANEIAYKIKLADTVLADLSDGKKGTMIMVGANQISFRNENSSSEQASAAGGRIPISSEDLPEGYTDTTSEETAENENSEEEYIDEEYVEDGYAEEENYEDEYADEEYYAEEYVEEETYEGEY